MEKQQQGSTLIEGPEIQRDQFAQQSQQYQLFPERGTNLHQQSLKMQLQQFNSFRHQQQQSNNGLLQQQETNSNIFNSPNIQINNKLTTNINSTASNIIYTKQSHDKTEDFIQKHQKKLNPEAQQKQFPKRSNFESKTFVKNKNNKKNSNKKKQQNSSNNNNSCKTQFNQFSNYLQQQKQIKQQQQAKPDDDDRIETEDIIEVTKDQILVQNEQQQDQKKKQQQLEYLEQLEKEMQIELKNQDIEEEFQRNVPHDVYATKMLINIIQEQSEMTFCPQQFLANHTIKGSMRGKMVDWMIEVTNAYKCSDQALFLSISIMDRFFLQAQQQQLTTDLHLIGVCSMFIASKYEDIIPIRLQTLQEKIAHNKFTKKQIQDKEVEILTALDFCITGITLLDVVQLILKQLDVSMYLDEEGEKYLHKVCIYLAKMVSYEYELVSFFNFRALAGACVYVAFKILEQFYHEFSLVQLVQQLKGYLSLDTQVLIKASTNLLYLARNFDQLHNQLSNLKKYSGQIFQDLQNLKIQQINMQQQQQQQLMFQMQQQQQLQFQQMQNMNNNQVVLQQQ